jgi:hypothetical protein
MAFTFTRQIDEGLAQAMDLRTPRIDLVHLASHKRADVRTAVAARRDCPLATMIALVHDHEGDVLEALALNPSAPQVVLESLAAPRKDAVRVLALRRLRYMGVAA